MSPRALQTIQNVLVTAVAVVLALVVWAAFIRIIQPPDPDTVAANEAARTGPVATTLAPFPGVTETTTPPDAEADPADTSLPTSTSDVCREDPPAAGAGTVLRVYYTCGSTTVPTADKYVYRSVPNTDLVLTKTLEELVKGPEPNETQLGFVSFFSSDTENAFVGVNLDSGTAQVNFTGLEDINNLSTSAGSQFFVANLNANVFQFDTINAVEYRLDGSCDAFWSLLQSDCQVITRSEFDRQVQEWRSEG